MFVNIRRGHAVRFTSLVCIGLVFSAAKAYTCDFSVPVDFNQIESDPDFSSTDYYQKAKNLIQSVENAKTSCRISDEKPDQDGEKGDLSAQGGLLIGTQDRTKIHVEFHMHGAPQGSRKLISALTAACKEVALLYKERVGRAIEADKPIACPPEAVPLEPEEGRPPSSMTRNPSSDL